MSMTSITRLARTVTNTFAKTVNPRAPRFIPPPLLYDGRFEHHRITYGSEPKVFHKFPVRMAVAGLLGFGLADVAFADNNEAIGKAPLSESASGTAKTPPAESSPGIAITPPVESSPGIAITPPGSSSDSHQNLEDIARKDKSRLEELLRSKGGQTGFCPRFAVSVKGQKVTIKFQLPPACDIPFLITNLVSRLGVKPEDSAVGSDMILRAWDSGVAWQLTLSRPKTQNGTSGVKLQPEDSNANGGEFCILLYRPLVVSEATEIEFMKQGSFSFEELDALATVLQIAGQRRSEETKVRPRRETSEVPTIDKTISSLERMGVKIYGLKQPNGHELADADISWDNIAGYDSQKRDIEDTILLALKSPQVYDDIARGTRRKFESNRPRAVLFEGPPGTGKTSCARVIANHAGAPLLYVPLEIIMSKYYGESERLLGKVFSLANEIPDGAIIFLDEVDSLATARDTETHEATRRVLSVLLRQIDGFEQEMKVVVIAATNRKQDLDPALISRFDSMITFGLPDHQTREAIIAQYAKHLTKSDLTELASATEGMSGRDLRDVCQQAERHWASKIVREQSQNKDGQSLLPPVREYTTSALKRRQAILDFSNQNRNPSPLSKKPPQFDFL